MKKLLMISVLALALGAFVAAQATTPVKGDFGIGASA